ncbi:MAG: hypothetical protein CH104c_0445 [Candidatus Woesebacteria bacterium]|nr:MAG: hypothetical protein CH104c_0445 [Candidatus Woesebacteria bacterium]
MLRKIAEGSKVVTPEDIAIINSKIDKGFTTLVVAQEIVPNHFRIFSVGDSSALLLDSRKGEIRELTPRDEDRKGRLNQALGSSGGKPMMLRTPNIAEVNLTPGQKLVLATDGFTRYLDNGKIGIGNVLYVNQQSSSNRDFVKTLIEMANACGGSDNITVVSIPYRP